MSARHTGRLTLIIVVPLAVLALGAYSGARSTPDAPTVSGVAQRAAEGPAQPAAPPSTARRQPQRKRPSAPDAPAPLDPAQVARGQELYETSCQSCHGPRAEGERPDDPRAVDANGLPVAPALNGSMHAWHHTDEGLVNTILNGSARNPRMPAWSESGLTENDAQAIVTYLKSLWGPVQRRCQGPLHMDRGCIMGAN